MQQKAILRCDAYLNKPAVAFADALRKECSEGENDANIREDEKELTKYDCRIQADETENYQGIYASLRQNMPAMQEPCPEEIEEKYNIYERKYCTFMQENPIPEDIDTYLKRQRLARKSGTELGKPVFYTSSGTVAASEIRAKQYREEFRLCE